LRKGGGAQGKAGETGAGAGDEMAAAGVIGGFGTMDMVMLPPVVVDGKSYDRRGRGRFNS
jgi:hypothetical protein